jgi:hypothetical protein
LSWIACLRPNDVESFFANIFLIFFFDAKGSYFTILGFSDGRITILKKYFSFDIFCLLGGGLG